jgi:hypothetical protein
MYCIAQGRPCTSHKDVLVRPCITLRETWLVNLLNLGSEEMLVSQKRVSSEAISYKLLFNILKYYL